MKVLDLTLPTPEENLALDEALLEAAEAGATDESLRFWEAPQPVVVVGYANKIAAEVNGPACAAKGVPILRRCSGGGTVVQGPGCLSYSLVLRIETEGTTRNISTANAFIMARNRQAIADAVGNPRADLRVAGHTDLVFEGRKFSGNAQRRRRSHLLFHGTFLLNGDLGLIAELLRMPSHQPDYRAGRAHDDFITNLAVPPGSVKSALRRVWNATEELAGIPAGLIAQLVATKYANRDWNQKF